MRHLLWERFKTASAVWLIIMGSLGATVVVSGLEPKPYRADPRPAALCPVTQPQWITPDTFVMPPSGPRDLQAYYPCKLLKKEQDV